MFDLQLFIGHTRATRIHVALKYFVLLPSYYFHFTYYQPMHRKIRYSNSGLLLRGTMSETTKTNEIAESAIMRAALAGNRIGRQ